MPGLATPGSQPVDRHEFSATSQDFIKTSFTRFLNNLMNNDFMKFLLEIDEERPNSAKRASVATAQFLKTRDVPTDQTRFRVGFTSAWKAILSRSTSLYPCWLPIINPLRKFTYADRDPSCNKNPEWTGHILQPEV